MPVTIHLDISTKADIYEPKSHQHKSLTPDFILLTIKNVVDWSFQ